MYYKIHNDKQPSVIPHRYSEHTGTAVSPIGAIDSSEALSFDFTASSITSVTHVVMQYQRFTRNKKKFTPANDSATF